MRTFVLGDIHGANKALVQVLERCSFDNNKDRLICLGDICDGWPETRETIDTLLGINDLVCLMGNHDLWFRDWLGGRLVSWSDYHFWVTQGGQETIDSYTVHSEPDSGIEDIPNNHKEFVHNLLSYYIEDNNLFVHGGFNPNKDIKDQRLFDLCWDRDLWYFAKSFQTKISNYDRIFLGHTTVGYGPPLKYGNVWNLDTGAGWEGHLTIMDLETEEYWQSDKVTELYPDSHGRGHGR